jgi:hypothetical protein
MGAFMGDPDLLSKMLRGLDPERGDDRIASVSVPDRADLPASDDELRSIVVAGLVDLVAEDAGSLAAGLATVATMIATGRFALYERATAAEQQERAARMRGFEIGLTRSWLIPRLRTDIESYTARISALERALERP